VVEVLLGKFYAMKTQLLIYAILSIIANNSDIMRIIQRKGHEFGPCDRKESLLLDALA
jgi:hypothetical protein